MKSLYKKYKEKIRLSLAEELGFSNLMSVPQLEKIVINIGLGEALKNKKVIDSVKNQLGLISGQAPVVTYAKKSIASFKLIKGHPIGLKVTLGGARMYDFLEKLVNVVLPRLRDFRGLSSKSFDNEGNFTLGLTEQIVFPEIEYGQIDRIRGLEVTFVTNTKKKEHAKLLLKMLGMPFRKD